MSRRLLCALSICLSCILAPRLSFSADADQDKLFAIHYQAGNDNYEKHHYREAAHEFELALEVKFQPQVQYSIGRCYSELALDDALPLAERQTHKKLAREAYGKYQALRNAEPEKLKRVRDDLNKLGKIPDSDPSHPSGESNLDRAKRLFQAKKYAEAIPALEAAYLDDKSNASILFSLGQCHMILEHWQQAAESLSRFLQEDHVAPPSVRIKAEDDRTTALGHLTPSPIPKDDGNGKSAVDPPPPPPPLPRPRWRIALGASAIGVGVLMGSFGVGALSVNGKMVDPMDGMPGGTFRTGGVGGGLLAAGLVFIAGGAVAIALPERGHPVKQEQP